METLKPYYIKYKKQIIPTIFALASIFILVRIILPQLTIIGETNQLIQDKTQEIETLQQSLQTVQGLDEQSSIDNVKLTTEALPGTKDISLIFSALSSAASLSDASIRDFSLKIGGVYGRAEKSTLKGVPSLDVIVRISSATPSSYVKFSNEIQEKLPLAEVKLIEVNGAQGTYELSFFYKPYDLSLVRKQDKVPALTQNDVNLLNQLKQWSE